MLKIILTPSPAFSAAMVIVKQAQYLMRFADVAGMQVRRVIPSIKLRHREQGGPRGIGIC